MTPLVTRTKWPRKQPFIDNYEYAKHVFARRMKLVENEDAIESLCRIRQQIAANIAGADGYDAERRHHDATSKLALSIKSVSAIIRPYQSDGAGNEVACRNHPVDTSDCFPGFWL
jgi:hypothetical protein